MESDDLSYNSSFLATTESNMLALDTQFIDNEEKYVRLMIKEEAEYVKRCQTSKVLYPCKCTAHCSYQPIVKRKLKVYETLYKEYRVVYDQFHHHYSLKNPNKMEQAINSNINSSKSKKNAKETVIDMKSADDKLTEKNARERVSETVKELRESKIAQDILGSIEERSNTKEKVDRFILKKKREADKIVEVADQMEFQDEGDSLTNDYYYWFSDKTGATLKRMSNLAIVNVDRYQLIYFFQNIIIWIIRCMFLRQHCICLHCDFMEQSLLIHEATIALYKEYCEVYLRYLALWYASEIVEAKDYDEEGLPEENMYLKVKVMPQYFAEMEVVSRELHRFTAMDEDQFYEPYDYGE